MEQRLHNNITPLLQLLKEHDVQATFFIVGWIAEKHPDVVRAIMQDGHDIGCHSYLHQKVYDLSPEAFREDTLKAKTVLENICNRKITAYRGTELLDHQKIIMGVGYSQ